MDLFRISFSLICFKCYPPSTKSELFYQPISVCNISHPNLCFTPSRGTNIQTTLNKEIKIWNLSIIEAVFFFFLCSTELKGRILSASSKKNFRCEFSYFRIGSPLWNIFFFWIKDSCLKCLTWLFFIFSFTDFRFAHLRDYIGFLIWLFLFLFCSTLQIGNSNFSYLTNTVSNWHFVSKKILFILLMNSFCLCFFVVDLKLKCNFSGDYLLQDWLINVILLLDLLLVILRKQYFL